MSLDHLSIKESPFDRRALEIDVIMPVAAIKRNDRLISLRLTNSTSEKDKPDLKVERM